MNVATLTFAWMGILLTLLPIPGALARGGVDGGGGKAVVRRNSEGAITYINLLDFWEAETFHFNRFGKRKPILSDEPIAVQVENGLAKLNHIYKEQYNVGTLAEMLAWRARLFISPQIPNPAVRQPELIHVRDTELTKSDDSFEEGMMRGASLEQVIYYEDHGPGRIKIDDDLVDAMEKRSKTQVAALYLHEALYAVLRQESRETNSLRTRRAIGYIFSGGTIDLIENHIPKTRVVCESSSGRTKIYLYDIESSLGHTIKVSAERIAGIQMIGYSRPPVGWAMGSEQELRKQYLKYWEPQGTCDQRCDNGANWTLHQTPSNSPVDFDLDFTVKLTDYESMRRVTVTIDHLPGVKDLRAFKGSLSEEVVCRFEGVNDK